MFTFFLASAFGILVIATCGLIIRSISLTYLLNNYFRRKKNITDPSVAYPDEKLPFQLIQLPVYNEEPEMVKKLIDSACALDYPRSRMWIQILDDSDREHISRHIREHVSDIDVKSPEFTIHYLHRAQRHGYKAGNLNCTTAAALGYAREGAQKGKEAVAQLGKAHTMCPKDDELLFAMGMICMDQLRDNVCALKHFESYSAAKKNLAKDHRVFQFIGSLKQLQEMNSQPPPVEAPPAEDPESTPAVAGDSEAEG